MSHTVRFARREDSPGVSDLLVALANFEHLEPPDSASRERILRDIFSAKIVKLFVAVDNDSKKLVGYALYFFTYSSFLARPTLYLEDIFVLKDFRRQGIGRDLFLRCVREAQRHDCGRMEWAVLTWNEKAIQFYEKLGAKRLDEWYYYRLTDEKIKRLSSPAKTG
ncbi:MAG TPA: GNAT family N-acetyltransferase [Nitrososphaerales archaeon]|nr:GNAT family N-acetyltransferase [Nitrososphaerales archaeon]